MKENYNKRNWNNDLNLGDHLYYACFNNNSSVVKALVNTTKDSLNPYYKFLNEAIKAEENKGTYEIKWKEIESNVTLNISPILSKFKIEKPKTVFKVFIEDINLLKEERNKLFFDEQNKTIRFDRIDIQTENNYIIFNIDSYPKNDEIIEINNEEVDYVLDNVVLKEKDILMKNNEKFLIEEIEILDNGWNVYLKNDKDLKKMEFNKIELTITKYKNNFVKLFDNQEEFAYEKVNNNYQCKRLPMNNILKDENNIEYTWKKNSKNKNDDIIIQLIDDEYNDSEKLISEYFFADDTLDIYQGKDKKNTFRIKSKKIDDKILVLMQDWKYPKILIKNENIKIKVDTGNLKKQRDSLKLLNNSPVKSQENLIKLFEKKSSTLWSNNSQRDIEDWYILKDEKYDGTADQREFVKKAISSDDFVILEGPPGSGKTTSILELILQLIKDGKKILLSASTHVAIDNVLERIEEYDKDDLVEALRIGRADSVGESINHLQIDNKIKEYISKGIKQELAEKLVIDGANLVCGTTMGINQLPLIKDRVKHENNKKIDTNLPMNPIFDYMIIDESSKTTFQEFLVPEMLAKKWILVGDIKQLSPFVEQSHIVHNFNILVPNDVQKAIRIVFETLYNNINPYIVEVSNTEEMEIKKYLEFWKEKDNNQYKDKIVSFSDETDLLKILGSDLILIKDNTWEKRKTSLPKTHIIILKNDKENDSFWFKQNYLSKRNKLQKFNSINKDISKNNSVLDYKELFKNILKEKNWAEEITWRMIRVYERRMLGKKDSYYETTYELLKPVTKDNAVDRIYNMTLPSILESLQMGNGETHRNKTTITEGFDKSDLKYRHTTLKTQHRMSPDISKFSRENFYTTNGNIALKDARTINREWNYKEHNCRAIWIDTPKSDNDKRNDRKHQKEVTSIINEIKKFLEYAKNNSYNNEGQPWSIAVLTFYKPQENLLREGLRILCNQPNKISRFSKDGIEILNYTVDKFQGMEADIVFLSMVRGGSIGFMDNINRLNVALTRAKYQRVIVGDRSFFEKKQNSSDELKKLAQSGGI